MAFQNMVLEEISIRLHKQQYMLIIMGNSFLVSLRNCIQWGLYLAVPDVNLLVEAILANISVAVPTDVYILHIMYNAL